MRPDVHCRVTKGTEGMSKFDINPDLLDMSQSILKDKGVSQGCVQWSLS